MEKDREYRKMIMGRLKNEKNILISFVDNFNNDESRYRTVILFLFLMLLITLNAHLPNLLKPSTVSESKYSFQLSSIALQLAGIFYFLPYIIFYPIRKEFSEEKYRVISQWQIISMSVGFILLSFIQVIFSGEIAYKFVSVSLSIIMLVYFMLRTIVKKNPSLIFNKFVVTIGNELLILGTVFYIGFIVQRYAEIKNIAFILFSIIFVYALIFMIRLVFKRVGGINMFLSWILRVCSPRQVINEIKNNKALNEEENKAIKIYLEVCDKYGYSIAKEVGKIAMLKTSSQNILWKVLSFSFPVLFFILSALVSASFEPIIQELFTNDIKDFLCIVFKYNC